ncbi:MAG: lytic transglycosylase domain-containing protein [Lentisphaerae bacterium]|jgi:hypothetical protein|nr:lytic transglycosylase domain-containing protein [Lentisphaerota bacterium]
MKNAEQETSQKSGFAPRLGLLLILTLLAGCITFDQDGNVHFSRPDLSSGQALVSELKERIANHDNKAVKEFIFREFNTLHGDDVEKLSEIHAAVAFVGEKAPFIPGISEYESWLNSRIAYFEAAEAAKQFVAKVRHEELLARQQQIQKPVVPDKKTAPGAPPKDGWIEKDGIFYPPDSVIETQTIIIPPVIREKPPERKPAQRVAKSKPEKTKPELSDKALSSAAVRDRNYWRNAVQKHRMPKRASEMLPRIEPAFVAAGLPSELVWIAEVESTMDPKAKSPAGAAGLFQLMPATARSLGLKTSPVDERLNPERNAKAAAQYLNRLYGRFGSWPLALAAYNAGEGRVSSLCRKHKSNTFDAIAADLPVETQMYVPRVLETIRLRTGVNPDTLPPPA